MGLVVSGCTGGVGTVGGTIGGVIGTGLFGGWISGKFPEFDSPELLPHPLNNQMMFADMNKK